MKKIVIVIVIMAVCLCSGMAKVRAQSAEVQQLLLDVTKLSQFKQLLRDLQTGYRILNKGYGTIKDIASGNFSLHEAFIDGLLLVNPALAKYRRGADIIRDEKTIVTQYKKAFTYFSSSGWLSPTQLDYIGRVYGRLLDKSLDNLDALATVLTTGKLSMTDGERLTEINRLYRDTHEMLDLLRGFNGRVSLLVDQLRGEAGAIQGLERLQGLGKD